MSGSSNDHVAKVPPGAGVHPRHSQAQRPYPDDELGLVFCITPAGHCYCTCQPEWCMQYVHGLLLSDRRPSNPPRRDADVESGALRPASFRNRASCHLLPAAGFFVPVVCPVLDSGGLDRVWRYVDAQRTVRGLSVARRRAGRDAHPGHAEWLAHVARHSASADKRRGSDRHYRDGFRRKDTEVCH